MDLKKKINSKRTIIKSTKDGFQLEEKEKKDETQTLGNLQINRIKSVHMSPALMGLILAVLLGGIFVLLWLNGMLPWQ